MNDISTDLRAEYESLADFASGLSTTDWAAATGFFHWTPWDEIAHLCLFDEAALLSAQGEQEFTAHLKTLMPRLLRGEPISAIAREAYGHLDGAALLAHWRPVFGRLVQALATLDPKARLPWYGPPMSARSFATARLMETWAHGQDVYDAMRATRPGTQRLRHVAHLGVTTYGWTFANRKREAPAPVPWVALRAPDGSEWTWGEPSADHSVQGNAHDFCLVVTQRRHVDDTALQVVGASACEWLAIAQCFAGPPADGPEAGARQWAN